MRAVLPARGLKTGFNAGSSVCALAPVVRSYSGSGFFLVGDGIAPGPGLLPAVKYVRWPTNQTAGTFFFLSETDI